MCQPNELEVEKKHSGEKPGRAAASPPWAGRTGPAGRPCSGGQSGPVSRVTPLFALSVHEKKLAQ
jgi:hypothetical protein